MIHNCTCRYCRDFGYVGEHHLTASQIGWRVFASLITLGTVWIVVEAIGGIMNAR